MKSIAYFNKELKENIDFSKEITDDSYEIKQLSIIVKDEDLEYYLNIINNYYIGYGKVAVMDTTVLPSYNERIASIESMLTKLMGV